MPYLVLSLLFDEGLDLDLVGGKVLLVYRWLFFFWEDLSLLGEESLTCSRNPLTTPTILTGANQKAQADWLPEGHKQRRNTTFAKMGQSPGEGWEKESCLLPRISKTVL